MQLRESLSSTARLVEKRRFNQERLRGRINENEGFERLNVRVCLEMARRPRG